MRRAAVALGAALLVLLLVTAAGCGRYGPPSRVPPKEKPGAATAATEIPDEKDEEKKAP